MNGLYIIGGYVVYFLVVFFWSDIIKLKNKSKMEKDKCILCGKDSPYEFNVDINFRHGYIEGAGQLCEECWEAGTDRSSILVPSSMIRYTPNDAELGAKVRRLFWETKEN